MQIHGITSGLRKFCNYCHVFFITVYYDGGDDDDDNNINTSICVMFTFLAMCSFWENEVWLKTDVKCASWMTETTYILM